MDRVECSRVGTVRENGSTLALFKFCFTKQETKAIDNCWHRLSYNNAPGLMDVSYFRAASEDVCSKVGHISTVPEAGTSARRQETAFFPLVRWPYRRLILMVIG